MSQSVFWRAGTTSTLPPSFGTQKLCSTSSLSSVKEMGRSTGIFSSLAVLIRLPLPSALGYSNSKYHWWPVAVTSSISPWSVGGWSSSNRVNTDQMPKPQDEGRGDDGPGDFQRGVAMDLRRARLPRAASVADDYVYQRAFDQHEDNHHRP